MPELNADLMPIGEALELLSDAKAQERAELAQEITVKVKTGKVPLTGKTVDLVFINSELRPTHWQNGELADLREIAGRDDVSIQFSNNMLLLDGRVAATDVCATRTDVAREFGVIIKHLEPRLLHFHSHSWNVWQLLAWVALRSPVAVEAAGSEPGSHHVKRIQNTPDKSLPIAVAQTQIGNAVAAADLPCESVRNGIARQIRSGSWLVDIDLDDQFAPGPDGESWHDLRFPRDKALAAWPALTSETVEQPKSGRLGQNARREHLLAWARSRYGVELKTMPGRESLLSLARTHFRAMKVTEDDVRWLRRLAPEESKRGGNPRHRG